MKIKMLHLAVLPVKCNFRLWAPLVHTFLYRATLYHIYYFSFFRLETPSYVKKFRVFNFGQTFKLLVHTFIIFNETKVKSTQ